MVASHGKIELGIKKAFAFLSAKGEWNQIEILNEAATMTNQTRREERKNLSVYDERIWIERVQRQKMVAGPR